MHSKNTTRVGGDRCVPAIVFISLWLAGEEIHEHYKIIRRFISRNVFDWVF